MNHKIITSVQNDLGELTRKRQGVGLPYPGHFQNNPTMPQIKVTLFGQMTSVPGSGAFGRLVSKHDTDKRSKGISSWTHIISMPFCHMANAQSLREISQGLRSATGNLRHPGIGKAPGKSALSYINANRSWHVFRD